MEWRYQVKYAENAQPIYMEDETEAIELARCMSYGMHFTTVTDRETGAVICRWHDGHDRIGVQMTLGVA